MSALREAVVKLRSDGASRLILDMRGNGGGVLDGALGIAGRFLERHLAAYDTAGSAKMVQEQGARKARSCARMAGDWLTSSLSAASATTDCVACEAEVSAQCCLTPGCGSHRWH